MTLDDNFIDQLTSSKEIFFREYYRFKPYLSVRYNKGYNVSPLNNDTNSRRLVLVDRGQKKLLNCLLLHQTWNLFKKTQKIENIFFSEFAPHTVSNTMRLFSNNITRYVLAINTPGHCGHYIDGQCFRSDLTPVFYWDHQKDFFAFNYGDLPRLVLMIDMWK
jgi:aspartyl/asparaginyl beta-hydroxylase (cupin superfamily)